MAKVQFSIIYGAELVVFVGLFCLVGLLVQFVIVVATPVEIVMLGLGMQCSAATQHIFLLLLLLTSL